MRMLRADEIECRVATISQKGCSLLLYKDARVDMKILDETYGAMNWKRHHKMIGSNLFCEIEVWDAEKGEWVGKEDVGTESYTEKEKGQASDSFKRAGFNFGIGRELYTAPFIWIDANYVNIEQDGGKYKTRDRFSVEEIDYEDGRIKSLKIRNEKMKKTVYTYGYKSSKKAVEKEVEDEEVTDIHVPNYIPAEEDKHKKALGKQVEQINKLLDEYEAEHGESELLEKFIYDSYKKNAIEDLSRVQAYTTINSFGKFAEKFEATMKGFPAK